MKSYMYCLISIIIFLTPLSTMAEAYSNNSFLPTWKLMSAKEKQYFIAGYVRGWNDTALVTDITIGYVKDNPDKAIDSLQKIKDLYKLSDLTPVVLVKEIDKYYANPANREASLSKAVSSAKNRLAD